LEAIKAKFDLSIASVGIHPTLASEEILRDKSVDIAVRNEPELACLDIANDVNLTQIKGVSYHNNGGIIHNMSREMIENLDLLPFPARDLFPHKNYRLSNYKRKPMTVVFTGRGCFFHCIHCGQQVLWRHRRRVRSAANIIKEIEEIHRMGYKEISFEDQIVECDERMIEVANALKKYNFSWKFGTRVDLLNNKAIRIFKESGCYEVFLGIESGDEACLNWLHKEVSLNQIEDAFKMCRKNDLFINATFMIGLPNENRESVRKTVELAKRLDPDYATFYAFTPLPGTAAFDFYRSHKLLTKDDWKLIDFQQVSVRTEYLSSREIEGLINEAYKEFYLRIHYVFKMLKRISAFSLIGMMLSAWRLLSSLSMRNHINISKEIQRKIIEEARKEYKRTEIVNDRKTAARKVDDYRTNGFNFAIYMKETDGWRIYIE
jgi:radical SAM superfamily enzyme YgiQ (UPF0313 family)